MKKINTKIPEQIRVFHLQTVSIAWLWRAFARGDGYTNNLCSVRRVQACEGPGILRTPVQQKQRTIGMARTRRGRFPVL